MYVAAVLGCSSKAHTVETDAPAVPADDGIAVDTGSAATGKVAVFVAQGYVGRTIISCDDGNTWVGNHSWDLDGDALMCGQQQNVNCGDTAAQCSYFVSGQCKQLSCCDRAGTPAGIVFGNGAFATAWGHAQPDPIRTSSNGIDWVSTQLDLAPAGPISFDGTRFITSSTPLVSDDGTTWTQGTPWTFMQGVGIRHIAEGEYQGGSRIIAIATIGGIGEPNPDVRDIQISSDHGVTWQRPTTLPATCANGVGDGSVVAGNGIFIMVDQFGTLCRSTDGGDTWSVVPSPPAAIATSVVSSSNGVWTGSEFAFWGSNTMMTSPDGVSWMSTPMVTRTQIGAVARSPAGTFVTILGQYGTQRFLRSTDGLTWETLPATSVVQSHGLRRIAFGYADSSSVCPLP